jgi:hypothetical protein
METHTYDSLYRTIKEQYSRKGIKTDDIDERQETIVKNVINVYNNPSISGILETGKTIIELQKPIKPEDDVNNYLYVHKNYI